MHPRRVTLRECARLTGFEDGFLIPVSRSLEFADPTLYANSY